MTFVYKSGEFWRQTKYFIATFKDNLYTVWKLSKNTISCEYNLTKIRGITILLFYLHTVNSDRDGRGAVSNNRMCDLWQEKFIGKRNESIFLHFCACQIYSERLTNMTISLSKCLYELQSNRKPNVTYAKLKSIRVFIRSISRRREVNDTVIPEILMNVTKRPSVGPYNFKEVLCIRYIDF